MSYQLDHFNLDTINRVEHVSKTAGGKGLNVARVVRQLGEKAAASGFLGGSLGQFISEEIKTLGVNDFFVPILGDTRNCIAVIHEGKQTELLESGPIISESEMASFLETFTDYIQEVELVTISGSLPKGVEDHFYQELLEIANYYNVSVLLDINGKLLSSTLQSEYKPFLIKPNEEELADLIGKKELDAKEMVETLNVPLLADIPWIVATRGKKGAFVKHEETIYQATLPEIEAINPVGSGDAVVAGFAVGLIRGLEEENLIKFGLAMGVLNAMEEKTGHVNSDKIDWMLSQIQVETIN